MGQVAPQGHRRHGGQCGGLAVDDYIQQAVRRVEEADRIAYLRGPVLHGVALEEPAPPAAGVDGV